MSYLINPNANEFNWKHFFDHRLGEKGSTSAIYLVLHRFYPPSFPQNCLHFVGFHTNNLATCACNIGTAALIDYMNSLFSVIGPTIIDHSLNGQIEFDQKLIQPSLSYHFSKEINRHLKHGSLGYYLYPGKILVDPWTFPFLIQKEDLEPDLLHSSWWTYI